MFHKSNTTLHTLGMAPREAILVIPTLVGIVYKSLKIIGFGYGLNFFLKYFFFTDIAIISSCT